tara:strand:- start:1145 stop:1711 length:567 start_codon:yes stop_codon:yes gene_type:complete
MAYDLKNVFYLGFSQEYSSSYTSGKDSVQPIDVSAYVDPISKGRARGQGLAVYRVHQAITKDDGTPCAATETANMGMALSVKPYTTTGEILTGEVALGDLSPSSDLVIQASNFQGIATTGPGGSANKVHTVCEPSDSVPYVVVRDTIFSVMSTSTALNADILNAYRMECAMIALDTATLNQLLRTQTA